MQHLQYNHYINRIQIEKENELYDSVSQESNMLSVYSMSKNPKWGHDKK